MMKIIAIADTHLFTDGYVLPMGDMLIHAGDHGRHGGLDEMAAEAAWLASQPHPVKVAIAGNHDWAFVRNPTEARRIFADAGIHYLEDSETHLLGLSLWGSPWQPEYNDWAFNLPRGEALAARWALIPDGLDILITHGPPAGIGDRSHYGARRSGCAALRARVEIVKPKLHIFGHIHEDGGAWHLNGTWFVNCTSWECDRPATVIEWAPDDGVMSVSCG